jgi:hypothetical protein
MAYFDVASLAADADFALRTTAAYATESLADPAADPPAWQAEHSWAMAAQPGFGDAYASAIVAGVPRPGKDPSVISDAQILSALQSLPA